MVLQGGCSRYSDPDRGHGFDDMFRGLANHNGNLRFRDIHLFNEEFPSAYETHPVTSNECTFFTLPLVDGYIWSKPNQIAGLRLKAIINGNETVLEGGTPVFTKTSASGMHISWPLKTISGSLEMDLNEQQIEMKLQAAASVNWFFDLTAAENIPLPFTGISAATIDGSFEGMKYILKAVAGSFSKPGNGAVFRISPQRNTITLYPAGTNKK